MAVKIQVIFYSMYGHLHTMAESVAAGVREVDGAEVAVYQVAELVPPEALERSGAAAARKAFAHIPVAKPDQIADADGLIFGTPTRFGNMSAQMRNFLDQTGGLWAKGALSGRSAACSPRPVPSTAVRRRPSPASITPCSIWA